jgi:antitoxin component of MazEF toxin-antitoxin module
MEKHKLSEGQMLRVEDSDSGRSLKLVPATRQSEPLARLLERITPANRHDIAQWGAPRGAEAW